MRKIYLMFAVLSAFLLTTTATAGTRYLVKQDFESGNDPALMGWKSPNYPGGMSISGDEYGNYFQYDLGTQNGRSCYWMWGSGVYEDQVPEGVYHMELEWCYKKGSDNQYGTQFRVLNTDTEPTSNGKTANSNDLTQLNWLFTITEVDADRNFYVNDNTAETFVVNIGEWMKISLDVDILNRNVTYLVTDVMGQVTYASGTRYVPEDQSMYATGINQYNARRNSVVQMDNISVSVSSDEDIANPPTVALTGVNGVERTYTITFSSEEQLHLKGTDGAEQTIDYMDCDGSYKYVTTTSGVLQAWTVSGSATSEIVYTEIECVNIALPGAEAIITSVESGYAKTYTLKVENTDVPTQPTLFLEYKFVNENGEIEAQGSDKFSGEKVTVESKGTLTVTTIAPGFTSTTVSIVNDKEFAIDKVVDFQHMTGDELSAKGFERLEDLDSSNTSGESNWTGRMYLNYSIDTGTTDEEGNPVYEKHVVYGPTSVDPTYEPIQRYRFLQSNLDSIAAHTLFAPVYTWYYNDGITATSCDSIGQPLLDANGNAGGTTNLQVKIGIGLVHSGVQGDTESYDPAGVGYGNIRIQDATLGVDGLTDNDFIVVYKMKSYGNQSVHPVFPVGTTPEDALQQYKAMNLGSEVEVYTGLETFKLYRVDTSITRINILKGVASDGIEEVNTGLVVSDHNAPIYNLNGIQVKANTLRPGIYIKQGKKFIVR